MLLSDTLVDTFSLTLQLALYLTTLQLFFFRLQEIEQHFWFSSTSKESLKKKKGVKIYILNRFSRCDSEEAIIGDCNPRCMYLIYGKCKSAIRLLYRYLYSIMPVNFMLSYAKINSWMRQKVSHSLAKKKCESLSDDENFLMNFLAHF